MPSPFTPFKEQQVQPLNILPYTAGIADSIQKGVAGLGEGIGGAIQQYKKAQEENTLKAGALAYDIKNYLTPEMEPVEDTGMTGNGEAGQRPTGKILLKENTPSHLAKLYKQAEKQGDGDWVKGLASVSGDEIKTAFAVNGYHKQEIERLLKDREANTTQELKLLQIEAEKQKLEAGKIELDRAKQFAEINATSVPTTATLTRETETPVPSIGTLSVPWKKDDPRWKSETPESWTTKTAGVWGADTVMSYDVAGDINALGLNIDDVRKKQEPVNIDNAVKTSIARAVSGDPDFDISNPDSVTNTSTKKKKFINEVLQGLIQADPDNAEKYRKAFLWNGKIMGPEAEVTKGDPKTKVQDTFKLAVNAFNKSPTLFEHFSKKTKINRESYTLSNPPKTVKIISEEAPQDPEYTYKTVTLPLTEERILQDKYARTREKIERSGGTMLMSETAFLNASGIFGNLNKTVTANGTFYTNKAGDVVAGGGQGGINSLSGEKQTTEISNQKSLNKWFGDYVNPVTTPEGKTVLHGKIVGNTRVVFQADPQDIRSKNYQNSNRAVDRAKMQEVIRESEKNVQGLESQVEELKAIRKEMNLGEKSGFTKSALTQRYKAVLTTVASLARKDLIGTGTETQPDWDRIAQQLLDPSFINSIVLNDADANAILDNVVNLVKGKSISNYNFYGFKVYDNDSGDELLPFQMGAVKTAMGALGDKISKANKK